MVSQAHISENQPKLENEDRREESEQNDNETQEDSTIDEEGNPISNTELDTPSPEDNSNATQVSDYKHDAREHPSLSYAILSSLLSIFFGSSPSHLQNPQQASYQSQQHVSSISNLLKLLFLLPALLSNNFMSNQYQAYCPPKSQHYMFERINERYERDSLALRQSLNPISKRRGFWPSRYHTSSSIPTMRLTENTLQHKFRKVANKTKIKTAIVLELKTFELTEDDIDEFSDKITFILSIYHSLYKTQNYPKPKHRKRQKQEENTIENESPSLEVILLLESPGGVVQDYGLLASQLSRLTNISSIIKTERTDNSKNDQEPGIENTKALPPIQLTICVDKIAASGGFMLASQASPNSLFASPFSCIGSIGVISERVNFHKLLKKYGIKSLRFASSKGKNPIGMYDEITEEGQEFVQRGVDRVYDAFKEHVKKGRNMTDDQVEKVATGEVWLGSEAMNLGLVDDIKTSDEYILEKVLQHDTVVLKLMKYEKSKANIGFGGFSILDLLLSKHSGGHAIRNFKWSKCRNAFFKSLAVFGVSSHFIKSKGSREIFSSFTQEIRQ